jgi:hypothetical protein
MKDTRTMREILLSIEQQNSEALALNKQWREENLRMREEDNARTDAWKEEQRKCYEAGIKRDEAWRQELRDQAKHDEEVTRANLLKRFEKDMELMNYRLEGEQAQLDQQIRLMQLQKDSLDVMKELRLGKGQEVPHQSL